MVGAVRGDAKPNAGDPAVTDRLGLMRNARNRRCLPARRLCPAKCLQQRSCFRRCWGCAGTTWELVGAASLRDSL